MTAVDYVLPVALGLSLAAATGFRVFAPMLVMGLAMHFGYMPEGGSLAWVGTTPALFMLTVAALAEVAAYYIPGLDNLLDAIATPAAVIAGITVSAAVMTDLPPMLKWTLAIIAGGGIAGITQGATAFARGHSTVLTAGLGNPVIATGEIVSALTLSVLALFAPYLALLMVVVMGIAAWRIWKKYAARRRDV